MRDGCDERTAVAIAASLCNGGPPRAMSDWKRSQSCPRRHLRNEPVGFVEREVAKAPRGSSFNATNSHAADRRPEHAHGFSLLSVNTNRRMICPLRGPDERET